jgi:hypothetical protein
MFNENWYPSEQINDLLYLCKNIPNTNGLCIEIGCWEGKSTNNIANAIYPENLICNDTWLGNIDEGKVTNSEHPTTTILKERDVYNIFINNMNNLTKGNYTIVKECCLTYLSKINEPIKFCHIDASHDYDSVHKTIKLLLPNLVNGSILCGDDFCNSHIQRLDLNGGVERAVRELLPGFNNCGNLWFYIHNVNK